MRIGRLYVWDEEGISCSDCNTNGNGISGVASASDDDRGDQVGTFKLPRSNTPIGFYGSVRFNAIHDFKQSDATLPSDFASVL